MDEYSDIFEFLCFRTYPDDILRTRKELLDENLLIISRFAIDSLLIPTASYVGLYLLHIHYASRSSQA